MNSELERIWKKVVMAYPGISLRELEIITNILSG
jgi:hypothetical protein